MPSLVLLPYGFLLEYNTRSRAPPALPVLLPYGFLLEYNGLRGSITLGGVLLSYVFCWNSPFQIA